jgi:L-asparaginase II
MLAFASQQGWVTNGYHRPAHPAQQRICSTIARWMQVEANEIEQAVDGCGLPTFALPLDAVAEGCARFAAAVDDKTPAPSQIFMAMNAHPEMVAGTGRLDSDLMRTVPGRLFSKVGAEGFYAAAIPARRLGLALKVEDGANRASEPVLLAALRAMDVIGQREFDALGRYALPIVVNTRGETAGHIRTSLSF